jgi:hypothetical protein
MNHSLFHSMGLFTQPPKKEGKPSQGLFGPKPTSAPVFDISKINSQLSNMNSRLRMTEERFSNLREKTTFIEENMISADKKIRDHLHVLTSDIDELRLNLDKVKQDMGLVIKELQNLAKKQDVDTLRKYINLWDPIKFVTAREVTKIIENVVSDKMDDLNLRIQEENFIEEQIKVQLKKMLRAKHEQKDQ